MFQAYGQPRFLAKIFENGRVQAGMRYLQRDPSAQYRVERLIYGGKGTVRDSFLNAILAQSLTSSQQFRFQHRIRPSLTYTANIRRGEKSGKPDGEDSQAGAVPAAGATMPEVAGLFSWAAIDFFEHLSELPKVGGAGRPGLARVTTGRGASSRAMQRSGQESAPVQGPIPR